MIGVLLLLLVTVVGTIVGTVLAMEAWASTPHMSRWLLRKTVSRFPADLPEVLADRWAKELDADLASFEDRRIVGLLFALRLRLKGGPTLAAQLALAHAQSSGHSEADPPSATSADAEAVVVTMDEAAYLKRLRELESAWVLGSDVVEELHRLTREAWQSQGEERE